MKGSKARGDKGSAQSYKPSILPKLVPQAALLSENLRKIQNFVDSKLERLPLIKKIRGHQFIRDIEQQLKDQDRSLPRPDNTARARAASLSSHQSEDEVFRLKFSAEKQSSAKLLGQEELVFAKIDDMLQRKAKREGRSDPGYRLQRSASKVQKKIAGMPELQRQVLESIKSKAASLEHYGQSSEWRCVRVMGNELQQQRTDFGTEIDKLNNLQNHNNQVLSELLYNKLYLLALQGRHRERTEPADLAQPATPDQTLL